jgi:predicted acyl esterase
MKRVLTIVLLLLLAPSARAATVSQDGWFTASDGVQLRTTVTGAAPLSARPTLVEFSPYGRASGTFDPGPDYNQLLVQIRGTGDSHGSFDALGPRTQQDVAQALGWACHQPFSDGRLALNGFSASAITIYNSLHLRLPCVKAALLKSGTFELYRDLLVPGGLNNLVPGAGVVALIGGPAIEQGADRDPATILDAAGGMLDAGLSDIGHPTLDSWWRERGFRGDVNHLPVLAIDGFFDVESRGAFEGYQRLRRDGAHLVVIGGHEGAPKGTDGGAAEMHAWLDRYVRRIANGVAHHPRVQLWLSDGDRVAMYNGTFRRYDATDWPVPGTKWRSLWLGAGGTLGKRAATATTASYPAAVSSTFSTDPPNAGIVGGFGFNALSTAFPQVSDMNATEPLGLSYTTAPLTADLLSAGPAALDVTLSSTASETPIWTVLTDVSPDGVSHPLTAGRLSSAFPRISRSRSLIRGGRIVQPLNRLNKKEPSTAARRYRVELWPVGNRFKAGDRIRLDIVGASAATLPGTPAINTITLGGPHAARLLLPVLPA